jgi:hypothetical protein
MYGFSYLPKPAGYQIAHGKQDGNEYNLIHVDACWVNAAGVVDPGSVTEIQHQTTSKT